MSGLAGNRYIMESPCYSFIVCDWKWTKIVMLENLGLLWKSKSCFGCLWLDIALVATIILRSSKTVSGSARATGENNFARGLQSGAAWGASYWPSGFLSQPMPLPLPILSFFLLPWPWQLKRNHRCQFQNLGINQVVNNVCTFQQASCFVYFKLKLKGDQFSSQSGAIYFSKESSPFWFYLVIDLH